MSFFRRKIEIVNVRLEFSIIILFIIFSLLHVLFRIHQPTFIRIFLRYIRTASTRTWLIQYTCAPPSAFSFAIHLQRTIVSLFMFHFFSGNFGSIHLPSKTSFIELKLFVLLVFGDINFHMYLLRLEYTFRRFTLIVPVVRLEFYSILDICIK